MNPGEHISSRPTGAPTEGVYKSRSDRPARSGHLSYDLVVARPRKCIAHPPGSIELTQAVRILLADNTNDDRRTTVAYELPPLPYDYAALEPFIDEATMKLHHDKHHQTYVTNLNGAVEKHAELGKKSPQELIKDLASIPEDVRKVVQNNGGGHVNHTMFWQIMKPKGGGEPTGEIGEQIKKDFGSFEDFKKTFNETTAKQFGSGWGWLTFEGGKLKISTTANQDNPLSQGHYPILGNDVWEHAYYLKYQNKRPDYLAAWWNTVNWEEINKRFVTAKSHK